MLARYSVKDLYALALAEGEGMGTAYEYYVKRMALARYLAYIPKPREILIAGLPERYGASLDFVLLASELGARLTVVDDRPQALDRLQSALDSLHLVSGAPVLDPPVAVLLTNLDILSINGRFDLALSSEVLQRLPSDGRASYVSRLRQLAPALALFAPNAENQAHTTRSGLAGLRIEELRALMGAGERNVTAPQPPSIGFIDMPPFPPGITRSAEQREEATQGRFEGFVMWGLGRYAHMERFLPAALRRRESHIVYALTYN
jgi:hypothetical protein